MKTNIAPSAAVEPATSRGGRHRNVDTQRIVDLLTQTGTPWRAPAIADKLRIADREIVSVALAGLYRSGVVTRCAVDVHNVHQGDQARYEYRISAALGSPTMKGAGWIDNSLGPLSNRDRERHAMIEERRIKATHTSDQPDIAPRAHATESTAESAPPVPAAPAAKEGATGANGAPVFLGIDQAKPGADRTVHCDPRPAAYLVQQGGALAEALQRAAAPSPAAPRLDAHRAPTPRSLEYPIVDEDAVIAGYARQHPARPLDSATVAHLIQTATIDEIGRRLQDDIAAVLAAIERLMPLVEFSSHGATDTPAPSAPLSAAVAQALAITDPAQATPLRAGHYSDGTLILEHLPNCPGIVALPKARADELIAFIRSLPACA